MKWRNQKSGTKTCGQIAIAVILNISLKKAIKLVGHDTYTNTKDLIKILRQHNYQCPNRLKHLKRAPELAICKLSYIKKNNKYVSHWHWVVIYKDKIFDGVYGDSKGNVTWKNSDTMRITSYLPIKLRR